MGLYLRVVQLLAMVMDNGCVLLGSSEIEYVISIFFSMFYVLHGTSISILYNKRNLILDTCHSLKMSTFVISYLFYLILLFTKLTLFYLVYPYLLFYEKKISITVCYNLSKF
ncbi:hypothetical protein HanRHA438_Chr08g0341811 [Helianthus annuus]|nr:hypothetical protein HanIR_Chr08g0357141 [Helianthus annuus]KAJ0897087.1 hypothetical protein HanRHA438_Chr08g0341811 [Helianthus annuus]